MAIVDILIPIPNMRVQWKRSYRFRFGNILFVDGPYFLQYPSRFDLIGNPERALKNRYEDPNTIPGVFAISRIGHDKTKEHLLARHRTREAVFILACMNLGLRQSFEPFGLESSSHCREIFAIEAGGGWSHNWSRRHPYSPFDAQQRWRFQANNSFVRNMDRHLRTKGEFKPKWFAILRRSAAIAGESMYSRSMPQAFLLMVIALETLLSRRSEKKADAISRRVLGVFGGGWLSAKYGLPKDIRELYKVRSGIVHQGDWESVLPKHLVLADELFYNILSAIMARPRLFYSSAHLDRFIDENEARMTLGMTARKWPVSYHHLSSARGKKQLTSLTKHFDNYGF